MVNFVARRKAPRPAPPVKTPEKILDSLEESGTTTFWPNFAEYNTAVRLLSFIAVATVVIVLSRSDALNIQTLKDYFLTTTFALLVALVAVLVLRLMHQRLLAMSNAQNLLVVAIVLVVVSFAVTEAVMWGFYYLEWAQHPLTDDHNWRVFRTVAIATITGLFLVRYFVTDYRAEMETKAKQADRLQALQSRIRPHFMFNSLNSVASLIRLEPEVAEVALEDLADLFRVLLADARKMVPVTVEGELARQYLEIEKIRLGERLSVRWTASNVPRSALLPSLTLQPLVENAVYHGIEPSSAGGTVVVRQWSEGETLNILISNPLPEVQNKSYRKGNNIALDNVRERLERHFGGRALLRNGERNGFYEVQVRVPIMRG